MHLVLPMLSESLMKLIQWECVVSSEITQIVRPLRYLLLKSTQ